MSKPWRSLYELAQSLGLHLVHAAALTVATLTTTAPLSAFAQAADVPPAIAGALVGVSVDGRAPGACSGVMIAPDVAVTARHCAFERRSDRPLPNLAVVSATGRHLVVAYDLAERSPFDGDGRFVTPEHDWAYLKLEGPAAPSHVRFIGAAGLLLLDAVPTGPRPDVLIKLGWNTRSSTCILLNEAVGPYLFAFRCGAAGDILGAGRSGSGLFVETDAGPALVGVHVGAIKHPPPGFGLAVVPQKSPR